MAGPRDGRNFSYLLRLKTKLAFHAPAMHRAAQTHMRALGKLKLRRVWIRMHA